MLKLASILCAVVFFGSRVPEFAAARRSNPRLSAHDHVMFAQKCIEHRSQMLGRAIQEIYSLPSENYTGIFTELKKNMTANLLSVRLLVNDFIAEPSLKGTYNETKCRSFYADHEKAEEDVMQNLGNQVSAAFNTTLTRIQTAKHAADAGLEQIWDLQSTAASCYRRQCHAIEETADQIRFDAIDKFSEFSCLDKSPFRGIKLILQMELKLLEERGRQVLLKTWDCIYNGHPPHLFHHRRHRPDQKT